MILKGGFLSECETLHGKWWKSTPYFVLSEFHLYYHNSSPNTNIHSNLIKFCIYAYFMHILNSFTFNLVLRHSLFYFPSFFFTFSIFETMLSDGTHRQSLSYDQSEEIKILVVQSPNRELKPHQSYEIYVYTYIYIYEDTYLLQIY